MPKEYASSHCFKFKDNDVFINSLRAYPKIEFDIYEGVAYYNKSVPVSGAFTGSILSCDPGYISLYEQNIDRSGSSGMTALPQSLPVFERAVKNRVDPTTFYSGRNPKTQPFIVKDGTRIGFRTVSTKSFNSSNNVGDVMTENYPLSASISKEYYPSTLSRTGPSVVTSSDGAAYTVDNSGSVSYLYALINTLNFYQKLSPYYVVSSSFIGGGRDLTASSPSNGAGNVGLLSVPSIFYGSSIKKGSVSLKTYISGTLVAELQDINRDGRLVQISGTVYAQAQGSASVAGVVLYNEGFVVLTGSWALDPVHQENYDLTGNDSPRWTYFAQTLSGTTAQNVTTVSSSYYLGFKGTTITPTVTMLAHAGKNLLNHSNNPTFVSAAMTAFTGSTGYMENANLGIKNTTYTDYNDPTGSFKKITYITQIGIYDAQKNLIGIAKLATPVKKPEDRDFTFKLKLDI
tara:strand:+ start:95 stop:1471 length:1377 start_codon:yes stop_codon:yes gene_type:complete